MTRNKLISFLSMIFNLFLNSARLTTFSVISYSPSHLSLNPFTLALIFSPASPVVLRIPFFPPPPYPQPFLLFPRAARCISPPSFCFFLFRFQYRRGHARSWAHGGGATEARSYLSRNKEGKLRTTYELRGCPETFPIAFNEKRQYTCIILALNRIALRGYPQLTSRARYTAFLRRVSDSIINTYHTVVRANGLTDRKSVV